jgi:hypothetical protein
MVSSPVFLESIFLKEATMSYARPVHHQQLPTMEFVCLVIAMVFITFVVVPGALGLLGLLVSHVLEFPF